MLIGVILIDLSPFYLSTHLCERSMNLFFLVALILRFFSREACDPAVSAPMYCCENLEYCAFLFFSYSDQSGQFAWHPADLLGQSGAQGLLGAPTRWKSGLNISVPSVVLAGIVKTVNDSHNPPGKSGSTQNGAYVGENCVNHSRAPFVCLVHVGSFHLPQSSSNQRNQRSFVLCEGILCTVSGRRDRCHST